eukprot:1139789-Pelagomonas_calceolata.AAC.4
MDFHRCFREPQRMELVLPELRPEGCIHAALQQRSAGMYWATIFATVNPFSETISLSVAHRSLDTHLQGRKSYHGLSLN